MNHTSSSVASRMFHHEIFPFSYEWEQKNLTPFNELILSWNTFRPSQGYYRFFVSLFIQKWSDWLAYAEWGFQGQKSFSNKDPVLPLQSFQDTVECLEGSFATGFRIHVEACEGAEVHSTFSLHACVTDTSNFDFCKDIHPRAEKIHLNVASLSQMALNHSRNGSFCSPTSTTSLIRHLNQHSLLCPLAFAQSVHDAGFDICGNWTFNVAQAFVEMGGIWYGWVARLTHFNQILTQLSKGIPLVVSVRGPLPGSACDYPHGHLIVIKGYDPIRQEIICMDPAFSKDEETTVHYALQDFVLAWERRLFIAYYFSKTLTQ